MTRFGSFALVGCFAAALCCGWGRDASSARAEEPKTPKAFASLLKTVVSGYPETLRPARVASAFDAALTPAGKELEGVSKKWPVAINLLPDHAGGAGPLLRLSIKSSLGLSLGDLEQVLGKPVSKVKAKESLVAFESPRAAGDIRVIASLLGPPVSATSVVRFEVGR